MPKVSAEHREHVRRRLLDAARRTLARKGYEATTTRDILDEAGVSAGTLYNYFAGKDALIEALAEEVIDADLAVLGALGQPGERAGDFLRRLLADHVLREPGSASGVLAQLRSRTATDPESSATVARFNHHVVKTFRPLVEAAQVDGAVRTDLDVDALIELIDLVWDGMTRRAATGSFETSYERVGAVCFDLLLADAFERKTHNGKTRKGEQR